MELIFLGTGAGVPSKSRNVTSIALSMLNERGSIWLFDCGEGTQHQILRSQVKLGKLEKIFITHLHGDHIFGLPGLLSSRSFQGGETAVTIYGPAGIREYVETSLSVSGSHLTYPLHVVELEEGQIFADEMLTVTCGKLDHGIESFGFRIVQADKNGTLDAARLKAEGVKPGPLYQQLKNGETVTLDDGRLINGLDYIGPSQKGRVVAIFGDTRALESEIQLAEGADVIVHEATFSADKQEMAAKYMHSTTHEAAELARKAQAKHLILTHISSRYDQEASRELLREARQIFPHTDLANDFAVFPIEGESS
ncbi:ribonuclease Z [Listeria costaricensis]|uniref:ribonuclease Z n=1 Tax=Listeria costaricensis TaxID=2026604 RepID=UPI000C079808|nr:ribonuclease Z [Listeria costaricensis]